MPAEGQSRRDALPVAEDAVRRITDIGRAYGFSDIGQFIAPPPLPRR
jgi:hypothetical protein